MMMMMRNKKQHRGFTLVELSIVLVIIGLIVGGVLVGQDLIKAARIRAQITQLQQFDAGVGAFRVKYDALPGDIVSAAATAYGLSAVGGNNNARIEDANNAIPVVKWSGETAYFFAHLGDAQMIPGFYDEASVVLGTGFPQTALKRGGILASNIGGGLFYFVGLSADQVAATAIVEASILTPQEAFGIDSKLDDGLPATGGVIPVTAINTLDSTDDSCIDATPAPDLYALTSSAVSCQVQVRAGVN